jgi:hypothetical protein
LLKSERKAHDGRDAVHYALPDSQREDGMRKIVVATALLLSGLLPSDGNATTITFDHNTSESFPNYTDQGFLFTSAHSLPDALKTWGAGSPDSADPSSTSATLFNSILGSATTLTAVGGGAFNLASIDFADLHNGGADLPFSMTFNFVGGGSTTGLFTLDLLPGLETFTFNYANLLSVTWTPSYWLQWDNVNVAAGVSTVPIPAALPLFASALAGMGFVGWRRRKTAAAA